MKTTNQYQTKRAQPRKPGKARGPAQRDTKEVMAELVARLSQKLDTQSGQFCPDEEVNRTLAPNRERLTVGVDLGYKRSNFCILGLDGETLVEGELQTSQQDFSELFGALAPARVVMEVGTHSAWARDAVALCGHEVLVANPRQMEGPKKRKRKNDRIDAHKLARVGRMDCETRNGSQPAAARNLIPLSRFPQGESRGGAVPPTPRHVPCQPTSPARPLQRLPPQEGSAPLRIPHLSAAPETKKTKDGRHVGLDFYDLLIEPLMSLIGQLSKGASG